MAWVEIHFFAEATPQNGGLYSTDESMQEPDQDSTIPATDSQIDEAIGGTPTSIRGSSPPKSTKPTGSGSSPAASVRSNSSSVEATDPVHSQRLALNFVYISGSVTDHCSNLWFDNWCSKNKPEEHQLW